MAATISRMPEMNSTAEKNLCDLRVSTPRFVIGAPQGRSGKTTVALMIAGALRKRGVDVACFKKGPDYIDPSWLKRASGRECHNLDTYMMPQDIVKRVFAQNSCGADIALIEGSMGLFDGYGEEGAGTVADLAHLIEAPIILVVNAARMTQSVAPMVKGFQHFEPGTFITGVILNNVAGPRHRNRLKSAIENYCGIPVLGVLPKNKQPFIGERHLGLVPTIEDQKSDSVVETLSAMGEQCLDIDMIRRIAGGAPQFSAQVPQALTQHQHHCRIGVIRGLPFNFYYQENLDALQEEGAELVFIDALHDSRLPALDGLYIGGGFPELYAAELETNVEMRSEVARCVENGMPVYAECAGLMYLCKSISWQGRSHEMVGVIPARVEMLEKPQGHGYVEVEVMPRNPLFDSGMVLKGHEFHHSRLVPERELAYGYRVRRGYGVNGSFDGICHGHVFASYTHLHALGTRQWAKRFIRLVENELAGNLKQERTV